MDLAALFGQPLQRDPKIALTPPVVRPAKLGPEHKVQFVIELVGPRSIPTQAASSILTDQWYQALGQPEIYSMSPADNEWRTFVGANSGSLDSLALAWDILSEKGELNSQAGAHLLRVAESFGAQVQRRAMPLPPPADINRMANALREFRDALDIGVELMLIPKGPSFSEKDIWIAAAGLGFDLGSSGCFEFKVAGIEEPLLSLTPLGGASTFSLSAVERGEHHVGLMLGFSLPRSAHAAYSLDAAFRSADYLSSYLGAMVFNDADQPLCLGTRHELSSNLDAAVRTMAGTGIEAGSAAALKLFRA